jgi:hypothetical protein
MAGYRGNKILVLWATPRSTSTAFEWMMRMRGDMRCFHEPFGEPWYQGENPLWPRATADTPRTPGLTIESVWGELKSAAQNEKVFSKDFPHYIQHICNDNFLEHFNHSFLVRDPAKVTTSMYSHWPDFVLEETAFIEQRGLFDRLCDKYGVAPPVIDSDDLLVNPAGIVETYCNAVGIPYIEKALRWDPGERDEVSWYDGGSWHANLRGSDGLKPQPRKYSDIDEVPDRVKKIYEICLPHYQHLYQHRLMVG